MRGGDIRSIRVLQLHNQKFESQVRELRPGGNQKCKEKRKMKKFFVFTICALIVLAMAAAVFAGKKESGCTTIQSGTLVDIAGNPISPGYDKWGYNYQAHMFNGLYGNVSRPNPPVAEDDTNLQMKWNDAWLSNMSCDGDNKLDRHNGFPAYIGSGAWLTNHMSGGKGKDHWTYFVKIVAAPADATVEDGIWYAADGTEIGAEIWIAFAIIQEVESGAGATYVSPAGPGFGKYKP